MTRRAWLLVGAAVTIAAIATALMFTRTDERKVPEPGVTAADIARAEREGRSACAGFDRVVALIRQNDDADDVLATLSRAVGDASAAAARDPAWRPLASGLQAVKASLERDDPRAADVGVRVARAACDDAGEGD